MHLATLSDAPTFSLGKLALRSLAVPSRGSRELSVWRVDLPAGGASGKHSLDHEQVIVVNNGAVTAYIGQARYIARGGDALILPADTTVELRNETHGGADAIVISVQGFTASAGGQTFTPPWAL